MLTHTSLPKPKNVVSLLHHPLAAVGGQCTGSTPSTGHTVAYQRPLEGPLRAIDLEVLHTPIGVCRRQEFAHTPPGCNKYPGCLQNSAHKKRGHTKTWGDPVAQQDDFALVATSLCHSGMSRPWGSDRPPLLTCATVGRRAGPA